MQLFQLIPYAFVFYYTFLMLPTFNLVYTAPLNIFRPLCLWFSSFWKPRKKPSFSIEVRREMKNPRTKKMYSNDTYVIYLKCFRFFSFFTQSFQLWQCLLHFFWCALTNLMPLYTLRVFFISFTHALFLYSLFHFRLQYALLQIVVEACQKKSHCKFLASSRTMNNDPCPETAKFIEIAYKCRPCKYKVHTHTHTTTHSSLCIHIYFIVYC